MINIFCICNWNKWTICAQLISLAKSIKLKPTCCACSQFTVQMVACTGWLNKLLTNKLLTFRFKLIWTEIHVPTHVIYNISCLKLWQNHGFEQKLTVVRINKIHSDVYSQLCHSSTSLLCHSPILVTSLVCLLVTLECKPAFIAKTEN